MSYKVKKGDTLSGIAKAHNISLDELLKLNGISKDEANSISVGQELKISQPSPSTETPEFQVPAVNTQFIMGMNWKPTPKPEDSNMGVPYNTDYTKQAFMVDHAKTIQEQLIAAGYSVGSAGADGKWGKNSQSALDRALAEGYTLKGDKLIKPQLKPRSATATTQISNSYLKSNAEAIQKQLMAAGYNVGSHGADGKWGSNSQKALELAFSEGYILKDGKLVNPNIRVAQPARPGVVGFIKNHMSNDIYDNMYPYNYGDVKNSNGTYRQVSGSDPVEVQFKAGL
jgi:murein DD-endopeptidase MepM/ murein hydrolase activator NlpD